MTTACCPEMAEHLGHACAEHGDACPERVVRRLRDGTIGFPVRDGGDSVIALRYCPWCSKRLLGEELITVPMAAQILGISHAAVRQAIYAGRLPANRPRGTWYIDAADVRNYRVSNRGRKRRASLSDGASQNGGG